MWCIKFPAKIAKLRMWDKGRQLKTRITQNIETTLKEIPTHPQ